MKGSQGGASVRGNTRVQHYFWNLSHKTCFKKNKNKQVIQTHHMTAAGINIFIITIKDSEGPLWVNKAHVYRSESKKIRNGQEEKNSPHVNATTHFCLLRLFQRHEQYVPSPAGRLSDVVDLTARRLCIHQNTAGWHRRAYENSWASGEGPLLGILLLLQRRTCASSHHRGATTHFPHSFQWRGSSWQWSGDLPATSMGPDLAFMSPRSRIFSPLLLISRVFLQQPKRELMKLVFLTRQNLRIFKISRYDCPSPLCGQFSGQSFLLLAGSAEELWREDATDLSLSDLHVKTCLCRSRKLLYTVIFTWSLWFSHKVNSDISTYFVANATSSFRLPWFNVLGNQVTEEATVNINNQIRKNVNSKMKKEVVLKCIWPDLRTVTMHLKDFCLKTSWRLGNVALECRPGPGQSQTLGRSWGGSSDPSYCKKLPVGVNCLLKSAFPTFLYR